MEKVAMRLKVDMREAIRQGKSEHGWTVFEIDPAEFTERQRDALATCRMSYNREDGKSLPSPQEDYTLTEASVPLVIGEATVETAKRILDACANRIDELKEKKRREREERIAKILADPPEKILRTKFGYASLDTDMLSSVIDDERLTAKIEEAKALAERINEKQQAHDEQRKMLDEENKRKEAERKAEKERLAEERRQRRNQQIADWVADNGTENQKGRYALGLLPRKEIIDAMRDEAFSAASGFALYEEITIDQVPCDCYERQADNLELECNPAQHVTAEQFEIMKGLMFALPNATIKPMENVGYCSGCNKDGEPGSIIRISFLASITVGEFTFEREYASE